MPSKDQGVEVATLGGLDDDRIRDEWEKRSESFVYEQVAEVTRPCPTLLHIPNATKQIGLLLVEELMPTVVAPDAIQCVALRPLRIDLYPLMQFAPVDGHRGEVQENLNGPRLRDLSYCVVVNMGTKWVEKCEGSPLETATNPWRDISSNNPIAVLLNDADVSVWEVCPKSLKLLYAPSFRLDERVGGEGVRKSERDSRRAIDSNFLVTEPGVP